MRENTITSAQFGVRFSGVPDRTCRDDFGEPHAFIVDHGSIPMLQEAALLMAERGARLGEIAARLCIEPLAAARLLAPMPYRFDLPENPQDFGPNRLECRVGWPSGFKFRSAADPAILKRIHAAGCEWVALRDADFEKINLPRALARLEKRGFLRRDTRSGCRRVALTAHGEAAALLIKSRGASA